MVDALQSMGLTFAMADDFHEAKRILATQPPDLLITVPKSAGRLLDFHRAGELVELGRRLTAEAIDRADEFPPARPGPPA